MRTPTILLAAVALAGCKPPPEEENIELAETYPLLFKEFEQGCERLATLVKVIETEKLDKIDLSASNVQDRANSLDPLTFDDMDVTVPEGVDPAHQTPVVVFGRSRHDFDANVDVALEENQVCIESDSTVFYERQWLEGDPGCLKGGSCDVARSTNEVRKELSIIASGWYDILADFRLCETDDGRRFLAQRAWAEQVFQAEKANQSFAQSFVVQLWIEDADASTTKRVYAIWPEIVIGLGADAMQALIRDSLDEGFQNADAFGDDAAYCGDKREAKKGDFKAREN